ncbi:hypothetical protein ACFWXO_13810 [Kitasatospora sp. NPDC059088]|uniref:hypothetical protein n=1 Tax=Kitasatospora sp. NPDC059088 TaxID=3346722 RepID=UPI0036A65C1F
MAALPFNRTAEAIERGRAAADHFGLHQPDWAAVRSAVEQPGLRSRSLAAALRLLAAARELDDPGFARIHERLRTAFRAEARLVRWVRWYAVAVLRHGHSGVSSNTELHRYLVRLERYGLLLLTDRRPEGVAGFARLSLGLIHHLISGTDLPR